MTFLSRDQLEKLTGYKRPSSMERWLAERQWMYEIGADGYPRVLERYFEKRMMGFYTETPTEPDIEALRHFCGTHETQR